MYFGNNSVSWVGSDLIALWVEFCWATCHAVQTHQKPNHKATDHIATQPDAIPSTVHYLWQSDCASAFYLRRWGIVATSVFSRSYCRLSILSPQAPPLEPWTLVPSGE